MNELVKSISNDDIIKMCEEIYECKNTGEFKKDGLMRSLFKKCEKEYVMMMYLEEDVLREAQNRFQTVSKLLFTKFPYMYIK